MTKSRTLLAKYPIISDQVEYLELAVILETLERVLEKNISGDIVEFGCYVGTTSLFLRRLLDAYHSDKKLHVYDSFAGLPVKSSQDQSRLGEAFVSGTLRTSRSVLERHFKQAGLRLPLIYKGWFEKLTPDSVPQQIAFAFLDGDFYSSIAASLRLVWPRLSSGGVVTIDDYANAKLPGTGKAVDQFFGSDIQIRVEQSLAIITKH